MKKENVILLSIWLIGTALWVWSELILTATNLYLFATSGIFTVVIADELINRKKKDGSKTKGRKKGSK